MDITLASVAFIASALCAAIMGFAIQRGATCTVAAVDEIINRGGCSRLLGLGEASLWVVGGLLIAQAVQRLDDLPTGYPVTGATLLGGALLGIGAFVNRACVFGTLARLGAGEWAYAATPLGFYVGCVAVAGVFGPAPAVKLTDPSPVLHASPWIATLFAGLMVLRIGHALLLARQRAALSTRGTARLRIIASSAWSPRAATAVIGITFLFMLLLVGAWAYTDALAELARGMASNVVLRSALMIALFAGALAGGAVAGRFRSTRVSMPQLARCVLGGALMGCGSVLIPGGNDGLILVGMPLLQPYAWVAFATMCASIAAAFFIVKPVSTTTTVRAKGAAARGSIRAP